MLYRFLNLYVRRLAELLHFGMLSHQRRPLEVYWFVVGHWTEANLYSVQGHAAVNTRERKEVAGGFASDAASWPNNDSNSTDVQENIDDTKLDGNNWHSNDNVLYYLFSCGRVV